MNHDIIASRKEKLVDHIRPLLVGPSVTWLRQTRAQRQPSQPVLSSGVTS